MISTFKNSEEIELMNSFNLLTGKPIIYAANVEEDDLMDDGESNANVTIVRDFANETDPYHANRPIAANFNNFTSFKCGRNGAIAE